LGAPVQAGGRSKAGLDAGHQPPEEAPRQPGMVGQNDALSLGNHARYIAIWPGSDNEFGRGLRGRPEPPSLDSASGARRDRLGDGHRAARHLGVQALDHAAVDRHYALALVLR